MKLHPYRQTSVIDRENHNLRPLYYGLYCIIDKVGLVAYKLKLPQHSKIHPTFHVSKLKRSPKAGHLVSVTLPHGEEEIGAVQPLFILDRKMVKRGDKASTQVFVHWSNSDVDNATCEFLYDL